MRLVMKTGQNVLCNTPLEKDSIIFLEKVALYLQKESFVCKDSNVSVCKDSVFSVT